MNKPASHESNTHRGFRPSDEENDKSLNSMKQQR